MSSALESLIPLWRFRSFLRVRAALLCVVLHGPATLQEIIIMHPCFKIHLRPFGQCTWWGEGRRVSVAVWLFCVFGSVEFLEIVVGKARALFLSCDGEGIAKRCFRTCVWVNVQILLRLSSRLGPKYKYGNGYEAEKPPMSMCWLLILAGFCIKPFYRLRLFLGG